MKDSWSLSSVITTITLSFFIIFTFDFGNVFAAPTRHLPTRHLCHPEQRDAILEFKNEFEASCLDDSNPPKTESWANISDCCYWDGITCDDKFGDVIELDLSFSCLFGQLYSNSSLFRLQQLRFLTTLDLSSNDLTGQIPSSLEKLSNLTTLDLSRNHFSGSIPSSIGNLSHLASLDFSHNNFSGEIPPSLGYLSHLTSLNLSYNYFSGRIDSSIGNLSNLITFRLSRNSFSGELPSSLGSLSHLTNLSLDLNNFSGEIPSSLGNLSHLTFLDFHDNKLSGEIPFSLGNLSHLTSLILSDNNFVGEIPSSFGRLNQLTILNIKSNMLSGSFPVALQNLTKLSQLSLSNNHLTGTLPSFLFTIPSLETLSFDNNQLKGTLDIGNNISFPSKLVELSLGNNNFRGPLPRSISKLVSLQKLDLSHFNIQGSTDFSIFLHLKSLQYFYLPHLDTTTTIELNEILSCLKSLDTLVLSGNHVSVTNKSSDSDRPLLSELDLSGCGITEFPELLRTLQDMTYLDISNNKIGGEVPGWLWTLPALQHVNLSSNTFIGFERSTKHEISSGPESSMKQLFGSNNNFTGKIPSFICALPYLSTLDLSNNKFIGSIPRCMEYVQALNLRHNRLSGDLPEDIFKSLNSLDVGHNQLVGKLPRSLTSLDFLEFLNVESNKINDTFPFWLSSLPELQVLVLRSNKFHGPIQQTHFAKLRIIDISGNQFNGTLPPNCFVNWTAMFPLGKNEDQSNGETMPLSNTNYMGTDYYYFDSVVFNSKGVPMEMERIPKFHRVIDFSRNKFEGEIPRSIGLLKELYTLNLSDNAFTGHIPSSMGNLTTLESLDVSQNKLSGAIPQELGNLSFLAYMNFSHNQLVGLVPGGTQFRRQPCSSFKDNLRLYGPALDEVCVDIHAKTSQQDETPEPEEEEDEEEVLSWIAVAIGFIPGTVFGLTMGYISVSYKPEWFMNPFRRNQRRAQAAELIRVPSETQTEEY